VDAGAAGQLQTDVTFSSWKGSSMQFKLFGWLSSPAPRVDTPVVATTTPAEDSVAPRQACPPCTGHCFQGRACPSSPTADKTLLEVFRRSPLH